jgi:hypothetical protein
MDGKVTVTLSIEQLIFIADHLVSMPLRHEALIKVYCQGICDNKQHLKEQITYHKRMLEEISEIREVKAVDQARCAWIDSIR